jgi:hypothetical protein
VTGSHAFNLRFEGGALIREGALNRGNTVDSTTAVFTVPYRLNSSRVYTIPAIIVGICAHSGTSTCGPCTPISLVRG